MSSQSRPIWRPYTQEKTASPSLEVASAQGAYLTTKSGQRIFDGISSWWLITHGHCHPEIVEAVQRQAAKLDQVVFANFTHEPAEEMANLLVQITPPELTRVFLSDNGSTAVEVALKMAIQSWAQKGHPEKYKFIAFAGGYHGDTVGAMSVSGKSVFNEPYSKTLFDVLRARHPSAVDSPWEDYTADFERLLAEHGREIAGVIIEPLLQGASGMIVWPELAVIKIAELCRKNNIYLIFDEVMTGFGRTGRLFAMDRLEIAPDLVCLSKGLTGGTLPLSVTMAQEEIYQSFLHEEKTRMLFHGHSFTGNPISCAAAVASLKLFMKPETTRRLELIEAVQREQLNKLICEMPIRNARVCGTVAAFDLDVDQKDYGSPTSSRIFAAALEQGLFIRPLGSSVYLMPPYCSTPDDLKAAWHVLKKAATASLLG